MGVSSTPSAGFLSQVTNPNGTGGFLLSNTATTAASGWEATVLSATLNMLLQWLKQFGWYRQNTYAIPTLLILGLALGVALWHDETRRAVLAGLNIAGQAWANYNSLKEGPLMAPAEDMWTRQSSELLPSLPASLPIKPPSGGIKG